MSQPLDEIVASYIRYAIESGEAIASYSSSRVANRAARKSISTYLQLEALGAVGLDRLRDLLAHESVHVRLIAAVDLLKTDPQSALPVVRLIAQQKDATGFSASMVLELWEKGKLKFPPFESA